jgi:hypothetical protein
MLRAIPGRKIHMTRRIQGRAGLLSDLEPHHLLESEQVSTVTSCDHEENVLAVTTAHDGPRSLHVHMLSSQWLDLAASFALDPGRRHLMNEHLAKNPC